MTERYHPEEALERTLAECVNALEERGWDRLEEVLKEHGALSGELRRRLESLRRWGFFGEREQEEAPPRRLGGFVLIERIGGGGMGVVYRAREEALDRDVAIKIMRPEGFFFEDARDRFQREAEAIARLRHPGIVPVFRVGEDGGVPFIAMELVPGCTTEVALDALRPRDPATLSGEDLRKALGADPAEIFSGGYAEACARLVLQVADALDHAHARGVLHRDVKPSNVVVSRTGRAMVIDFGLALTEGTSRLTGTGAIVGSLPYLPAEAIEHPARPWSARGDVYALGVTLHELLTLRLPFHAASAEGTRRLILEGPAPRPRDLNAAVPRDLDAVCRVAMERDASRRYASTAELAQDLRNALAGRPVEASPSGPLLRAGLWVRRRPALASSLLLAGVLAVGVPTALFLQAHHHAKELGLVLAKERTARREAEDAHALAHAEATRSDATLSFVLGMFASASPYVARGEELLAGDLVRFGAANIREWYRDDPVTRARMLLSLGELHAHLEKFKDAEELIGEALELFREHAPAAPQRAAALVLRAQVLLALGRIDEVAELAGALKEIEDPAARADAALVLGQLASGRSRWDDAEGHLRRALELLAGLAPREPVDEAAVLSSLGRVALERDRIEDAIAFSEQALAMLQRELEQPHPLIARAQLNLGLMLKKAGRLDDAARHYADSLEASVKLWGEDSVTVAGARVNIAGLHEARRDLGAAIDDLRLARATFEAALGAEHPNTVQCRGNLAGDLYAARRFAEAIDEYREVIPLQGKVLGPRHPFVAASTFRMGDALWRVGEVEESLGLLEELTVSGRDIEGAEYYVVLAWLVIASRRQDADDLPGAAEAFAAGLAFADDHCDPQQPNVQFFLRAYLKFAEGSGDAETAASLRDRLAPR